jgi:NAD+ synthase (glutamine-hydrolysing)
MPCFGTSARTRANAEKLCNALGISMREINIGESVKKHLEDIGHSMDVHDAAYENAQARERTQVLMDLANMYGGLVIGTAI